MDDGQGAEYLTRYRYDLLSGDKTAKSLGRRSPETEKIHDAYMKERAELDERIATLRPLMAEQARMAKALRVSRTPSEVGAVLRAIGTSDLIEHVTLVGDAAVFAYEAEMTSLLPWEVLPDEELDLLVAGASATESIDELVAVLRRAKIPVRPGRARAWMRPNCEAENLKIRLFDPSSVDRMVDEYENYFAGGAPRSQPSARSAR